MASSPEQNESVSTSDVWSMLPKDIAMRVLARLSVPQLFRARTVCKQWNLLTSSPEFLNLFSGQSHEPYFPIMTSRSFMARCPDQQYNPEQAVNSLFNGFFGYNHTTETWQRLPPLDFLPRQGLMLVAAAEGILCFQALCRTAVYCGAVSSPLNQFGVIAYDIQAEAWRKVLHNIPSPPDDSSDY
ncbi:F-box/kelch-repeat protein At5g15710-like [Physcomitrium patens]|uniref:F-box/kelch-repeat protein At5g15710-like n=1 Tax=Physcomitrium patens TaxID=3218 RepID=UPI003CCCF685